MQLTSRERVYYGCVAQLVEAIGLGSIKLTGSNPSASIMPMIMDPEDELKSLAQENKELRARIKELNNVINNKDAQLDAYRLKIDELQQTIFSIPVGT